MIRLNPLIVFFIELISFRKRLLFGTQLALTFSLSILFLPETVKAESAFSYIQKGRLKSDKKDYYGAISDYTKAIEINPNDPMAYSLRGIAKGLLGDTKGACDDTKSASLLGDEFSRETFNKMCTNSGNSTSYNNNESQEKCFNDWCIAKRGKDILGMPKIVGWAYMEVPEDRAVIYEDMDPYKVLVRGQYGRYIHLKKVTRWYQDPKAGRPGRYIGGGNATTNCYSSAGGVTCNSTINPGFYISARPAIPGGPLQLKADRIVDCEDKTVEWVFDGQSEGWKPWRGKYASLYDGHCRKNIYSFAASDFKKYE